MTKVFNQVMLRYEKKVCQVHKNFLGTGPDVRNCPMLQPVFRPISESEIGQFRNSKIFGSEWHLYLASSVMHHIVYEPP